MSFRDLRRKAAEIDEQHHESMRTIDDELGELHFGTSTAQADSRRRFLTRAAAGGAIAFGATVIPVASMIPGALAQPKGTTPGTTGGSTTAGSTPGTTGAAGSKKKVKPKTEGNDLTVVVFAQTVELAAVTAYQQIINSGKLTPAVEQTAREFAAHHQAHADKLAEWAGSEALNVANLKLLFEIGPKISAAGNQNDLLGVAQNLELGTAATYNFALGVTDGWEVAGVFSTILPVESQHALAWSQIIEPDPNKWAAQIKTIIPTFQNSAGAFEPSKYATN